MPMRPNGHQTTVRAPVAGETEGESAGNDEQWVSRDVTAGLAGRIDEGGHREGRAAGADEGEADREPGGEASSPLMRHPASDAPVSEPVQ